MMVKQKLTDRQKARLYKKYLVHLSISVQLFLWGMDGTMKHTPDYLRGKEIARMCNDLQMAYDQARHFGLGEPLGKSSPDRVEEYKATG